MKRKTSNRIFKTATGKKEFYLRSATGRELAIYEYNNDGRDNLKTVNLYGTGLIGRIDVRYVPATYIDPETNEPVQTTVRRDERFYYINDHLGSVRAIVDSSGTTVFAQDTYPYGDVYRNYSLGGYSDQKYDFTGKERDTETGLHYYGARYYDSDLGRWLQVDRLADKYPGWSPYNYCVNNPVRNVDPDGMAAIQSDEPDGGHGNNDDETKKNEKRNANCHSTKKNPGDKEASSTQDIVHNILNFAAKTFDGGSKIATVVGVVTIGVGVFVAPAATAVYYIAAGSTGFSVSTVLDVASTATKFADVANGTGNSQNAIEQGVTTGAGAVLGIIFKGGGKFLAKNTKGEGKILLNALAKSLEGKSSDITKGLSNYIQNTYRNGK